ncbi:Uncharacterized protein OBRU01_13437 [Operophtera brumata]|uniref:VWFA domain-containing protein n=1 Tax=Operophtera brumata TaxID=104452 RepID=A0A0L7L812_OPEBR|nr:Uncharacterized protein OBRU01_13437 [Operophtera brumata]
MWSTIEFKTWEIAPTCISVQKVKLHPSKHFDTPISLEKSSVHVAAEMFACVEFCRTWPGRKDCFLRSKKTMLKILQLTFNTFALDYDAEKNLYDCRLRPWYVSAGGAPRDVLILLDASGSMNNSVNTYVGEAFTHALLNALTDDDQVNVLRFNVERQRGTPDRLPSCQQAIVMLTDSMEENHTLLMRRLDPYGRIRQLITHADVTEQVMKILQVLERPLVAQRKERPVVFSDVYAHYPVNRLLGVAGVDIPIDHLKLMLPYHQQPAIDHPPRHYPGDWLKVSLLSDTCVITRVILTYRCTINFQFRKSLVIDKEKGNMTMYGKNIFEGGMRVHMEMREYHWKRVLDHYTAVVVLPPYSRHHVVPETARRSDEPDFAMKKIRYDFSPIPPTLLEKTYECDEGLMAKLCKEAVATEKWAREHEEPDTERDCSTCELGSSTAFFASDKIPIGCRLLSSIHDKIANIITAYSSSVTALIVKCDKGVLVANKFIQANKD